MMMDQLNKIKKEIEDTSKELYSNAEEIIIPFNDEYFTKHRFFLVDLYAENTELSECLGFLAQISKWFHVTPLTKNQVNRMQLTPEEIGELWKQPKFKKKLDEMINQFGEYKKVVDDNSRIAYKVPIKDIITKGLKHQELDKYPVWDGEDE